MAKSKHEDSDRGYFWSELAGKLIEDRNYSREFNEVGSVVCPCCDTTIYKEDESR